MPSNKKTPLKKSVQKSAKSASAVAKPAASKAKILPPAPVRSSQSAASGKVVAKPAKAVKVEASPKGVKKEAKKGIFPKSSKPVAKSAEAKSAGKVNPQVDKVAKPTKAGQAKPAVRPLPKAVKETKKGKAATKPAATSSPTKKGVVKKPEKPETSQKKVSAVVSSPSSKGTKKVSSVSEKDEKEKKGVAIKSSEPSKPPQVLVDSSSKKHNLSFLKKQKIKLLELQDVLIDSMKGVATDTLRARAEGSEGNAFGMHQADAGSDAYDRDFALGLLSQEQNSLYEVQEALKRLELGTYGVCEGSGQVIPQNRLEALPFTRYTVGYQAEIEKHDRFRSRAQSESIFGLTDDDADGDDDFSPTEGKD